MLLQDHDAHVHEVVPDQDGGQQPPGPGQQVQHALSAGAAAFLQVAQVGGAQGEEGHLAAVDMAAEAKSSGNGYQGGPGGGVGHRGGHRDRERKGFRRRFRGRITYHVDRLRRAGRPPRRRRRHPPGRAGRGRRPLGLGLGFGYSRRRRKGGPAGSFIGHHLGGVAVAAIAVLPLAGAQQLPSTYTLLPFAEVLLG